MVINPTIGLEALSSLATKKRLLQKAFLV